MKHSTIKLMQNETTHNKKNQKYFFFRKEWLNQWFMAIDAYTNEIGEFLVWLYLIKLKLIFL